MKNTMYRCGILALALALLLALAGCGVITPYRRIVNGSGTIETSRLELGNSMGDNKGGLKLHVSGVSFSLGKSSFTAELVIDEALDFALIWEADSNIVSSFSVSFDEKAGEIVVKPLRRVTFAPTKLRLVVGAPIRELRLDGAWNVTYNCPSVKACSIEVNGAGDSSYTFGSLDSLNLTINGAADANLIGSAKRASFTINGASSIHAFGLAAADASITVNGWGKCELTVTGNLEAQINGTGEIIYDGSPRVVDKGIAGVGRISARNS